MEGYSFGQCLQSDQNEIRLVRNTVEHDTILFPHFTSQYYKKYKTNIHDTKFAAHFFSRYNFFD